MNVAVQLEFKAGRKEPLGDLIRRVVAQFQQSGLQPQILATFGDTPGAIRPTSAVERAIKKFPHLARFERNDVPLPSPGMPPVRRLTNGDPSNVFPIDDIISLADGVPRSLPFHAVSVHFGHAEFGQAAVFPGGLTPPTGIAVGDGWWVNGRIRSLTAFYAVEGDATSKKLPDPQASVRSILAGLGKPTRTAQFVAPAIASAATMTPADAPAPVVPAQIALINPIMMKYRSGMKALIERISLPHDLPPPLEALKRNPVGSGPLKPALVEAFKPRGYDCRGGSGVFTLRRRTASNHVVDVELDVGTWSRSVTAMFHVHGPGFIATLMPPVSKRDDGRQYPIGDTANWERIVANLAAIVDELDRTFVVEIEQAAGPAPAWFDPGR